MRALSFPPACARAGTVSQGIAWKQWRGPPEFRPSFLQTWGYAVPAGWGPFEMVDLCNALGIDPVITLAYDSNSVLDFADLVEVSQVTCTRAQATLCFEHAIHTHIACTPSPLPTVLQYAWGDALTTSWGRQRAFDGHTEPYNVTIFELGNEQYNPSA